MTFESTIDYYESRPDRLRTLVHADESRTFIFHDDDPCGVNPRDYDGNVATLINESRDYIDLDSDWAGLSEARERWDELDETSPYFESTRRRQVMLGGASREDMVKRYIAIFRPDIAHYEDRWEVSGNCQGDWQYGWGYVMTEDMEKWGVTCSAEEAFEAEVKVYGLYFAGEVYGGIHVYKGDPIFEADFTGDELVGHEDEEDSCWGFLGYDNFEDIAANFTGSPVVESKW